jgi:hypothetical protein
MSCPLEEKQDLTSKNNNNKFILVAFVHFCIQWEASIERIKKRER